MSAKLEEKLGTKRGASFVNAIPGTKTGATPGAKVFVKPGATLGAKPGAKLGANLGGVLDMYGCAMFGARTWSEFTCRITLKSDTSLGANGLFCCTAWWIYSRGIETK